MKAEIITIGDEILIGQIQNTNSVWLAQQLNLMGITVGHMCSVSDEESAILEAFANAMRRAQLVLITGGLGPTKDDITKKTFARFFDVPLVIDDRVLEMVTKFFGQRGRELSELNRQQALVPQGCEVLINPEGTAPGMWMKKGDTVFASMPGVPHEMMTMMRGLVIPMITASLHLPAICHRTLLTAGIGESMLAEKIQEWEEQLSPKGLKLAYLPQAGIVKLRLSAYGPDAAAIAAAVAEEVKSLKQLIPQYLFGEEAVNGESLGLQKVLVELLRERGESLSIAESCTGGYLSSLITSVPGASEVYKGGLVPYTNSAKQDLLGLDPSIFEQFGAVSKECVEALAIKVRERFGSTYGIGISGIAGPSGGSKEKPVGLVWIAIADPQKVISLKFRFGDNRQLNITLSAMSAMNSLRKLLLKQLEN